MSFAEVTALSAAPVKGLRIARPDRLLLARDGPVGDRAMFLLDDRARMVNGKHHGELQQVVAELDDGELTLLFPDGRRITGPAAGTGEPFAARFYSSDVHVLAVPGAFSQELSRHAGQELRLVCRADGASAVDRGLEGAVTLVSRASVQAVAEAGGRETLDPRRFRMTIEIDGPGEFEEDAWLGMHVSVGGAVLRPCGHVGRCSITTRDPGSGEVDFPTLDVLRELRAGARTTEPLALGIFCEVVREGEVALGDRVSVAYR